MSIEIADRTMLHEGWLKVSRVTLTFPDGKSLRREVEDHGNAVAVLPYDPERRTALLIRQFRAPAFLSAGNVSLLEAIAGIIEEDDPLETARREAIEEAGVNLEKLEYVGRAWTTPGISTEQMTLYLATYSEDHHDGAKGGIGDEDITVAELSLRELAELADADGIHNMTTLALVQILRLRHPELFVP
jgi:nudix-type nucleoside diphosphatase (YffH/AdpP family)